MVMRSDRNGFFLDIVRLFQNTVAVSDVLFHDVKFLFGQRPRFVEYLGWYSDLADVVQQSPNTNGPDFFVAQPQVLTKGNAKRGDREGMEVRIFIFVLDPGKTHESVAIVQNRFGHSVDDGFDLMHVDLLAPFDVIHEKLSRLFSFG